MIDLTCNAYSGLQPTCPGRCWNTGKDIDAVDRHSNHQIWSAAVSNSAEIYLGLKAHVKHAVSLIKDQIGDSLACAGFHLDKINHSARGAHCHLRPEHIRCYWHSDNTRTMYAGLGQSTDWQNAQKSSGAYLRASLEVLELLVL